MYKIVYFVPEEHLDVTKEALFLAGAGKVGDYDRCSWQTIGQGQYRPLSGSTPFIGEPGSVSFVEEYRVELVCENHLIETAINALRSTHPYEEPAIDVSMIIDI